MEFDFPRDSIIWRKLLAPETIGPEETIRFRRGGDIKMNKAKKMDKEDIADMKKGTYSPKEEKAEKAKAKKKK